MTVHSMTGFGEAVIDLPGTFGRYRVTVRTVNHRHLDVRFRFGSEYASLESDLRQTIKSALRRGHVDVFLAPESAADGVAEVHVDEGLARQLVSAFDRVRDVTGVDSPIDLATIVRYPGVVHVGSRSTEGGLTDDSKAAILTGLKDALEALINMRKVEGERTATDLHARVASIDTMATSLETMVPTIVATQAERLRERIAELTDVNPDPERLAQEVAILADKMDVAEELTRLRSHCLQFQDELAKEPSGSGRKLEFITQEMLREFNTIGSKAADADARRKVIDGKSELERIREQVVNLE
jgi:uncharacterized protein (TIGR00255 family)